MYMKKIAVLTSGGDSPGMNACIRAIVRTAQYHNLAAVGIRRGYQGLIENDIIELDARMVGGIISKGGTVLGTARSKDFMTIEGRKKAYENLKKHGIDAIVACGGDGTFTGANVFMKEYIDIAIVGTPGTIDNDLYGTDYTIGYDTALNTAMEAIDKIRDTADAHNRLFFVEVMGRDAGFIALRSGIATGAEAILVPEIRTVKEELIEDLKKSYELKNGSCIVVMAEGDDAGHAYQLVEMVRGKIPYEDIRVVVLGHIQRGGSPSCFDRVLASRLGIAAVEALVKGKKGIMLGQNGLKITEVPFEKAIKHHQELSPYLVAMMEVLTV
jgi:6-phosphofructokinase 1